MYFNTLSPAPPINPIHEATNKFLNQQGWRGFQPSWLITFHYGGNPTQRGWNNAQRVHTTGQLPSSATPSLFSDGSTSARTNFFNVSKDAKHIRNLLRQAIWDVKRQDKVDESQTPMIFFHEQGKLNLQFHTHLLLGTIPDKFKTIEAIECVLNDYVMPRAQCISRTNSIHIQSADSYLRAVGYLSKELSFRHDVVDYEASCLFRQPSRLELIAAEAEE
jgi:hypothetical protein